MFEINNENSKTIGMYQWGITESGSDKPILQTYGIISCVGVSFYNNETKQAVLAHFAIDFNSDYSNAERMIDMIIEVLIVDNHNTKLDINIVHNKNNAWSKELNKTVSIFDNIYKVLSKKENLIIKNVIEASILAINSNTGEISTSFKSSEEVFHGFLSSYEDLLPTFNGCVINYLKVHKTSKLIENNLKEKKQISKFKKINSMGLQSQASTSTTKSNLLKM